MKETDPDILRIPLIKIDYCAPAGVQAPLCFFGKIVTQEGLSCFVKDFGWGTEPIEAQSMSEFCLGKKHVLAQEDWDIDVLSELISNNRVAAVLDLTDELERKCIVEDHTVADIDGHYVGWDKTKVIHGKKYARIVDPSYEDVVVEGTKGAILTEENNVYWLPLESLVEMWHDKNKNETENYHWALVMLHPDDDPSVLEKYRFQGKIE